MKREIAKPRILLLFAVLFIGLALFSSVTFAEKKFNPHQLTILFTGDDQGNIKAPCG
ncbi:MAG: hypothetical protein K6T99_03700 [Armatimonadetes bacterium]|nr:hypothetical protein [Armatimonadota bacterium]